MTEQLLVGIDAGLTNVKAAVFDLEGREIAVSSLATPGVSPAPDREEQRHDDLWAAVVDVVDRLLRKEAVGPSAVAGVGVTGHGHGLYALDADGEPARRGIKSTDSRAAGIVDDWKRDGTLETVRESLGWEPFGADPLSLLAWVKREEPETYAAIDRVLFCKDVVRHRLTGRVCTDEMEASVFPRGDDTDVSDVFGELGLEACTDVLPPVVSSTASCGTITAEAAAKTGLPAGVPVATGLHDVGACAFGAGATRPGDGVIIVGTWGQSIGVRPSPAPATESGLSRRYLDGWLTYRGNRSAAACVDWFVEECCADWQREATARGLDEYALYDETVANVSPGSDGVLFLPYLRGSVANPNARGGFYGLRMDHTKSHMLRAIYEGVAIAQCGALQELAPDDEFSNVRLTGGGARSDVWCEIFANVLDARVSTPDSTEVGARGAALCAGVAAGSYEDASAAADRAAGIGAEYEPSRAAQYRPVRERFDRVRTALEPTWVA
ncbi:carbohydrate kinase [Halobacteria archaeon AArc-m2/3/4]|uniref:Carbohydrate kinase n=1 Tax=Natronoglomus mannanivorans TaxID=2979990 RepID=A0ABT2QGN9_9EURY|nr:carbohydrate kinase [Halobacteria archaeon AArc-m2/3/4]